MDLHVHRINISVLAALLCRLKPLEAAKVVQRGTFLELGLSFFPQFGLSQLNAASYRPLTSTCCNIFRMSLMADWECNAQYRCVRTFALDLYESYQLCVCRDITVEQ